MTTTKTCASCMYCPTRGGVIQRPCKNPQLKRNVVDLDSAEECIQLGFYKKLKQKRPEIKKISHDTDAELKEGLNYKNNMQLVEEFQKKITAIYFDESRNFWIWKKKEQYYKRIDKTDILSAIDRNSDEYVIASTIKQELITAFEITGRNQEVKPIEPTWIHTIDDVIDYKTGQRFKPTPKYFFSNPIPHKIGIAEDTPTIDKLLNDWVGDKKQILYEILAYCLIDDYPIHRMFLLFGSGRNGKSQYQELITRLVGKNNITSTELEKIIDSRFEAVKLHRKKVALIGETNFTEIKNSDRIKKLCGYDPITAEYKNKDAFDFQNTAKIIIATNNLPETLDKTEGFYSRCIIIEFNNRFDEGKAIIDTIPEIEYENLLFKCLKIIPDLLQKGRFTGEGTIEEKAAKYERISNPWENFFNKKLKDDPEAITPLWVVYEVYKEFCQQNHFRIVSKTEVTQKMKRTDYEVKKCRFGDKSYTAVIGLTTKEPFIFEDEEDEKDKMGGGNVPVVPDVPPCSTYSPCVYNNINPMEQVEQVEQNHKLRNGINAFRNGNDIINQKEQTKKTIKSDDFRNGNDSFRNGKYDVCGICGQSLNGNCESSSLSGLGKIHSSCKFNPLWVKALVDIPAFRCIDDITRIFKNGESKPIPAINALMLIHKKVAVRCEPTF